MSRESTPAGGGISGRESRSSFNVGRRSPAVRGVNVHHPHARNHAGSDPAHALVDHRQEVHPTAWAPPEEALPGSDRGQNRFESRKAADSLKVRFDFDSRRASARPTPPPLAWQPETSRPIPSTARNTKGRTRIRADPEDASVPPHAPVNPRRTLEHFGFPK
jgi:hypothetical protein